MFPVLKSGLADLFIAIISRKIDLDMRRRVFLSHTMLGLNSVIAGRIPDIIKQHLLSVRLLIENRRQRSIFLTVGLRGRKVTFVF